MSSRKEVFSPGEKGPWPFRGPDSGPARGFFHGSACKNRWSMRILSKRCRAATIVSQQIMRGPPSPGVTLPCPFARQTRCDEVLVVQATGSVGDRSGHAALNPGPPAWSAWADATTSFVRMVRNKGHLSTSTRWSPAGPRRRSKRPGRRPGDSSQTLTSPALLRAIVLGPRPVTCLRERGGCCRSRPVGRALGLIRPGPLARHDGMG